MPTVRPRWLATGAGLALLACYADAAIAQDFPRLEVEVGVELQGDFVVDADDRDAETTDIYTTTEPYLKLRFTPEFSLEAGTVLEPVRDLDPREDRFFGDHGFYAEQLFFKYETSDFAAYVGKFNPPFGVAWDLAPGIYGTDFAEDYELTERVGLGGNIVLGGDGIGGEGFGTHVLSVNSFFADTSPLSNSALEARGRTDRNDGGPSNTEDLSSFTVTLDGSQFEALPGIAYHLGGSYQKGGPGTPRDETGVVGAISGEFELTERLALAPLLEVAYFDDAEGLDQDRTYVTAGASLLSGPWVGALSYTNRDTSAHDAALTSSNDDLFQASIGYVFDFGLTADVGYRFAEEDGLDSHVIGFLLTYVFDFAIE